MIFVLQAVKVPPKMRKGRAGFRYLHNKHPNAIENFGHGLKFAAKRGTNNAELVEGISNNFIRHFEWRVV